MKKLIKNLILTICMLTIGSKAFCYVAWINDLASLFTNNKAIIYSLNIRTFNAEDKNLNGIIEEDLGEKRGSFLSAIERLDELSQSGINTILLMPVTTTGKKKALGTAGSLYAPSSFDEINPQLKSNNSKFSAKQEMANFIDECHKRKIRVMVDLPACASYDLYLQRPELFAKDKNQSPIIPADWTDVRLLDAGTEQNLNSDVLELYQGFIDLMQELNVDGVRANVPGIKPAAFWRKIISETKARNPQFLFLAESSDLSKSPSEYTNFISSEKLLEAGFDGIYGNYSDFKNWNNASQLLSNIKKDIEIQKKYQNQKSVLANFITHDQISPMLVNGAQYSKMLLWLNATLPLNTYYIDGFSSGDTYIYPLINKKATKTYTDDEYYFVHRGQPDIFNFSRINIGKNIDIFRDFLLANKMKNMETRLISNGDFTPLRTTSSSVFAYKRSFADSSLVVIGNMDFKKDQRIEAFAPKLNKDILVVPIKMDAPPIVLNGKIRAELKPGEIIVLMFSQNQAE